LQLFRVTTITKAQMQAGLYGEVIKDIGGPPQCDVGLYSITYETIGVNGEPANASAALFVPSAGCKGPFPLVGYSHGTNLVKEQLITQPSTISKSLTPPDQDPIAIAAIFAAHGYATVATDYLGLGLSTYPYHPYLQAASEASAVIDSIRAAERAAKRIHVGLTGKLFLTGHSQGGQSTVATEKQIEAEFPGEFRLRGVAPSSGPYALTKTFEHSLRDGSEDAPILAAYTLTGYEKTYGNIYSEPQQIFKQPYAQSVDELMPVQTFKQEDALEGKTLPLSLSKLLQPSFVRSFLNDPQSGARVDTARNDLLSGWKAKSPMYLCGGSRDPEVDFPINALSAYAYFQHHGSGVQLVDVNQLIPKSVPIVDYHVTVALFCLPLARRQFFDPLR
jgi:pimeloyl-ACP methyl ester carboxylesterase